MESDNSVRFLFVESSVDHTFSFVNMKKVTGRNDRVAKLGASSSLNI